MLIVNRHNLNQMFLVQKMKKINTILLVDDNKTTLQLNKWLLEDYFPSDRIFVKSSGKAALEFIQDQANSEGYHSFFPLLIFCDVYMPEMSGWDLIAFLKAEKGIDQEQVFTTLLSAYVHPEEAEIDCLGKNTTCIHKPLTDENVETIKKTFNLEF